MLEGGGRVRRISRAETMFWKEEWGREADLLGLESGWVDRADLRKALFISVVVGDEFLGKSKTVKASEYDFGTVILSAILSDEKSRQRVQYAVREEERRGKRRRIIYEIDSKKN